MNVHKYLDYDEYKEVQLRGCRKTIDWQWVKEDEIQEISDILLSKLGKVDFGICHGTRQGYEQKWFSQFLNAEVLGTDITPEASNFPNTIEWDFHEVKEEWRGAADFIYSNSFDHSYAPEMCLVGWMGCLKPTGYCILHWSEGHLDSTTRDPFGATLEEYKEMIESLGYIIDDVTIIKPETKREGYLLWIQRTPYS